MLLEILEDGVIVKPRVSFLKYGEKDGEVGVYLEIIYWQSTAFQEVLPTFPGQTMHCQSFSCSLHNSQHCQRRAKGF